MNEIKLNTKIIENRVPVVRQDLTINDKEQAKQIFDLLDVSETTRQDYKYRIGLFLDFISERGFNRNSFLEFKRYLADRINLAINTKNKYLTTAKIFLKENNRRGLLSVDITQNIKAFTQSKKHRKDGLNDFEIKKLTGAVKELPMIPQNTRLKAILALLTLQGLRQIEIIRLDVKDIDFASKTAMIQGKGRDDKERIYLQDEVLKLVKTYLKTNKIADGALFVSQSNNSRNKRLTTRALRSIVKKTLNALGIEKSTHGFRHYFTSKLIKAYGGDLLEIARYTRHRSLETLQIYNDNIKAEADLPRFYKTFNGVKF